MPSDPANLYRHLPSCYSRNTSSDLYKLLAAYQKVLDDASTSFTDLKEDTALSTADGVGLDRAGENYGIGRPPGMLDAIYSAVLLKMAGMRRGTVAAIKVVLETATGVTWTVEDNQINSSVPLGEVWCTVASGFALSYGRGMYPSLPANWAGTPGDPLESATAGVTLDEEGVTGGYYNDHAWGELSRWTMELVDKVKAAGIKVVYY